MLNHISIWQMVIDACLVTSILIMAFRYAKSTRTHSLLAKVVELEGRVSVLMAEIEGRAKHVSDQLIRREQNLSRYISDIEKREKDINVTLNDGEALLKELSLVTEGARREALELEREIAEIRTAQDKQQASTRRERRREYERLRNPDPFDQSDDDAGDSATDRSFSTRQSSRRASEWIDDATLPAELATFGGGQEPSGNSLKNSYKAAEEMLKRGRGAEEVSKRTSIPLDGVKRLAQMIEIEREELSDVAKQYAAKKVNNDPRLGALGVSRRTTSPS